MTGFFTTLARNLRALSANLRRDLHPGTAGSEDGEPARRLRRNFAFHLHPLRVTERALCPWITLGLGVISATLFAVLAVSGVLLMVYYAPTPREAYASMLNLQHAVTFGPFVRALHLWAAHGMVLTVVLHLVRIFAQAAYRRRELNWLVGLCLLLLTLGLAFTGYLLPWDGRAWWAVTVSANLFDNLPLIGAPLKALFLGGSQVGSATLVRFYTLHVALLPGLLLVVVGLHLWRIRKDGGLALEPSETARPTLPAWPHLVLREGLVILLVLIAVSLVAILFPAPLAAPPDSHLPGNPEKAPWYFLWVQEMVSYSAPVGGLVFPLAVLLLLLLLPFLDREDAAVGRWFGDRVTRLSAVMALALALPAVAAGTWLHLRLGAQSATWQRDLLNPASAVLALSGLLFLGVGIRTRRTRPALVAAGVALLVGVIGCLLLGLCRGPDWLLYWPWQEWPRVD